MSNAIRAAGTVVRYVKEVTAGTDPASWTVTLSALSGHLQPKQTYSSKQSLYQGSGGLVPAGYFKGRTELAWKASHYMSYKGMGLVLSLMLGDHGTTTGSGPYTHIWDIQKDPKTATIGVSADASATSAAITVTNAAYGDIHGHHAGTLAWNGSTYTLISAELTIPHGQGFRDQMGSGTTLRPYSTGQKEPTLRVVMEKVNNDFTVANLAESTSDAVITFTDASSHSLTITMHNAFAFDPDGGRKEGFDLIRETVTFRSKQDGTDSGLRITIVNDQATAEAA